MIRRSRSASKSSKSLSLSLSILLPLRWGLQALKNVYILVLKIYRKRKMSLCLSLGSAKIERRALTKGSRTNVFAIDISLVYVDWCVSMSRLELHRISFSPLTREASARREFCFVPSPYIITRRGYSLSQKNADCFRWKNAPSIIWDVHLCDSSNSLLKSGT